MTINDLMLFLEKNGAKEKFLTNASACGLYTLHRGTEEAGAYEIHAWFSWTGSPEGSMYWTDLADRWHWLYYNPTSLHRFLAGLDGHKD